jgi:hypothetical protein
MDGEAEGLACWQDSLFYTVGDNEPLYQYNLTQGSVENLGDVNFNEIERELCVCF